jgi:hypothetical protein
VCVRVRGCACACVRVRVRVCACACVCVIVCASLSLSLSLSMCVRVRVRSYVHLSLFIYICVCVGGRIQIFIYLYSHARTSRCGAAAGHAARRDRRVGRVRARRVPLARPHRRPPLRRPDGARGTVDSPSSTLSSTPRVLQSTARLQEMRSPDRGERRRNDSAQPFIIRCNRLLFGATVAVRTVPLFGMCRLGLGRPNIRYSSKPKAPMETTIRRPKRAVAKVVDCCNDCKALQLS